MTDVLILGPLVRHKGNGCHVVGHTGRKCVLMQELNEDQSTF